jgi:hypothetical protein
MQSTYRQISPRGIQTILDLLFFAALITCDFFEPHSNRFDMAILRS